MNGSSETTPTTGVLRYAAFGEVPGGGNPAGVVLDARGMGPEEMLAIAAEVGFSETAFVVPGPEVTIRYFSPLAEVAFCGHATIAASVALAEREGTGTFAFSTQVGIVTIGTRRRLDGRVEATFTSVPTRTQKAPDEDVAEALAALGWAAEDLDPGYPAHIANAGNDHLVLAVSTRDRLTRLDYDYDRLAALMAARRWTTVHLVWAEDSTTFHARDPFPPGGQVEDAATGAAAAAFGGYLRDLDLVELPATVVVRQGEDMGRPSVLTVRAEAGSRTVTVTGTALRMGDDD
ncbi:PhzF family phenazine biosynthesis protein [Actinokineospora sp. 24-640]